MKVTVLGCGPAGLLAAFAAEEAGCEVEIISSKQPSKINGAQYLHEHVEHITDPDSFEMVTFTKVGTKDGYAKKVYGSEDAPTSWDIFGIGEYPAWPLQAAYERLWVRFEDRIENRVVIGREIDEVLGDTDLCLSSVPARGICLKQDQHRFRAKPVNILTDPLIQVRNLVVYNGREGEPWYRASNLFGHSSVEYPAQFGANGYKPIDTNCDCHLDQPGFHRIGRFGQWKKGVLVTHALHDAQRIVQTAKLALGVKP
jgi:transposase